MGMLRTSWNPSRCMEVVQTKPHSRLISNMCNGARKASVPREKLAEDADVVADSRQFDGGTVRDLGERSRNIAKKKDAAHAQLVGPTSHTDHAGVIAIEDIDKRGQRQVVGDEDPTRPRAHEVEGLRKPR